MTTQVTPASLVEKNDWTMLTINKGAFQNETGIAVSFSGTITHAQHKFLGTPEGEPQLIVSMNNNMGTRFIEGSQITLPEFHGEIVTRADGTEISILELVNEKLAAAITPQPNQTPSV